MNEDNPSPHWYRVEHRHLDERRELGRMMDPVLHFRTLDPFLAGLPRYATGELVLVDESTNEVVARRSLEKVARFQRSRPEPR